MPHLLEDEEIQWICHRKVVYIPKVPLPTGPSDYRPISMLEALYKIPSRILFARLSRVLPTLIGKHQHGFIVWQSIQEPSLLATHLIQGAQHYNKLLQLVSFDREKAFDRVGHHIIVHAFRAFWCARDHDHGHTTLHISRIRLCASQLSQKHPRHYQDR